MAEAFIVDGIRSPIGRYGGALSSVRTDDLAAHSLKALMAFTLLFDIFHIGVYLTLGALFHFWILMNLIVYISAWGMVGGFDIASDQMWDVMAGAGYRFTDSFSAFGGYRAVSVDYSDDGFVYDVVQQGPVLAGVFRF